MIVNELSDSLEDYIEAIYLIAEQKESARATDIAERLNVKKGSVTGALHSLADKSLINYTPYDVVTLTAKGKKVARDVVFRHRTLADFFVKVLSIEKDEAEEAACRMEHAVSARIMDRLATFAAFVERCPRAGADWIANFKEIENVEIDPARCRECVENCMDDVKRGEKGTG